MAKLINRRKRIRLMLLFAAAAGCSSAAMSGTLAAFTYTAERIAEISSARAA
jgi:hypothetical protein